MERKEHKSYTIPQDGERVEFTTDIYVDGEIDIMKGDDMIVMSNKQATALHSALDEMLNPWRPVSEPMQEMQPYFITDGKIVMAIVYEPLRTYPEATHWKPITLPAKPKD